MARHETGSWLRDACRRAAPLRQWSAPAGHRPNAAAVPAPDPDLRDEARDLHQVLTATVRIAADARSRVAARDSLSRIDLPAGTDWRWRP